MPWGRFNDHLDDDERFLNASPADVGVFFLTLPRALREDADGVIPPGVLKRYPRSESRLVKAKLWHRVEGVVFIAPDLWQSIRMPDEIREKRRMAANVRWDQFRRNAHASQMQSTSNAEPVPEPELTAKAVPPKAPQRWHSSKHGGEAVRVGEILQGWRPEAVMVPRAANE
jgi:hypothetical protein